MFSLCNEGDCPYDNFTRALRPLCFVTNCAFHFYSSSLVPTCPSFQKAFTVFTGLQDDGRVLAGGIARVDCGEGYTLAETEGALVQIQCAYNFINETAEWDGDYRDLDTCVGVYLRIILHARVLTDWKCL